MQLVSIKKAGAMDKILFLEAKHDISEVGKHWQTSLIARLEEKRAV